MKLLNAAIAETLPTLDPGVPATTTSTRKTTKAGAGGHRSATSRAARTWNARVGTWESQLHTGPAFATVRDALIERAAPRPDDRCVDLGAGTGFLAIPLAARVHSVLAVDIAPAMLASLRKATPPGSCVEVKVCGLAALDLPAASLDLVVSSYALHHLRHEDKRALVARASTWLVPGGRIVIADMMFGKGASKEDRAILIDKVKALAAKGPGGWWRIFRNVVRFGLGVGAERPASPDFWVQAMRDGGFTDVRFERVVAESGIVSAQRPALDA